MVRVVAYSSTEPTLIRSENKKYQETVIVVPFFGATRRSLRRHIDYFNSIGYDTAIVGLSNQPKNMYNRVFSSPYGMGLIQTWRFEIEKTLDLITGPKIVYSFSNPCIGTLIAVSERKQRDIKALVCDSGPASDFKDSARALAKHYYKLKSKLSQEAFAFICMPIFYGRLKSHLKYFMKNFPSSVPVLSVICEKDLLISTKSIQNIFVNHHQLDIKTLYFSSSGHLEALKNEPDKFRHEIGKFLQQYSQLIVK